MKNKSTAKMAHTKGAQANKKATIKGYDITGRSFWWNLGKRL